MRVWRTGARERAGRPAALTNRPASHSCIQNARGDFATHVATVTASASAKCCASVNSAALRTDRRSPYGHRVPRISFFYGISIYMYWNEAHHARPHFHARYGGQAASIDLDGNLIAGSLPRRARTLVAEWTRLHRAELEANWDRARREDELEPVEPLP
jgi:hypothetical protein